MVADLTDLPITLKETGKVDSFHIPLHMIAKSNDEQLISAISNAAKKTDPKSIVTDKATVASINDSIKKTREDAVEVRTTAAQKKQSLSTTATQPQIKSPEKQDAIATGIQRSLSSSSNPFDKEYKNDPHEKITQNINPFSPPPSLDEKVIQAPDRDAAVGIRRAQAAAMSEKYSALMEAKKAGQGMQSSLSSSSSSSTSSSSISPIHSAGLKPTQKGGAVVRNAFLRPPRLANTKLEYDVRVIWSTSLFSQ